MVNEEGVNVVEKLKSIRHKKEANIISPRHVPSVPCFFFVEKETLNYLKQGEINGPYP